jgi:beta-galactosidase
LLLLNQCISQDNNTREILNFDKGWTFQLGESIGAEQPGFNDSASRKLNVPHDWSIEGEFSEKNLATAKRGGLPGGIGWYRKSFKVTSEDLKRNVFIFFDGVYQYSEVWINGHSVGKRLYGYSTFRYDLTPYLIAGEKGNVIAVRVDNSAQPNSRWYSGSGIFRNVLLGKTYIAHWGTQNTTPLVT